MFITAVKHTKCRMKIIIIMSSLDSVMDDDDRNVAIRTAKMGE